MDEKVFEIKIKSIRVEENGEIETDEKGANVIEALLFYPKEGVPALTTLHSAPLKDKETHDFSSKPYKNQILFKQSFQGESLLEINVSAEMKLSALDKAIGAMLGAAAKATVGTLTGLGTIAIAAVTSITGSIFTFAEKKSKVIGTGTFKIDGDIKDDAYPIKLTVPKDVKIYKVEKDRTTRRNIYKKLQLKKGKPNGEVFIEVKRIV